MLDELQHFLLVVKHGTVTEAARYAHLSQPALSASLKRLESHFGSRLLHRGRKGAEPTAAGWALVPRAQAVLANFGDALQAVREVEDLDTGEVRIGAGGTVATYMLPPVLARFRKKHPKIRIVLSEMTPEQSRQGVDRGELDLAIVPDTEGEPWGGDAFILVGAQRVRAEGQPFVTFLSGTSTRAALDRNFAGAEIVMELASIAAVKRHVRAGIGIALISDAAVQVELANQRLYRLRHPRTPLRRKLSIVHRGKKLLSPAAGALRTMLFEQTPSGAALSRRTATKRRRAR